MRNRVVSFVLFCAMLAQNVPLRAQENPAGAWKNTHRDH